MQWVESDLCAFWGSFSLFLLLRDCELEMGETAVLPLCCAGLDSKHKGKEQNTSLFQIFGIALH